MEDAKEAGERPDVDVGVDEADEAGVEIDR